MRISDWSSDVCSSDLTGQVALDQARGIVEALRRIDQAAEGRADRHVEDERQLGEPPNQEIGFGARALIDARERDFGGHLAGNKAVPRDRQAVIITTLQSLARTISPGAENVWRHRANQGDRAADLPAEQNR